MLRTERRSSCIYDVASQKQQLFHKKIQLSDKQTKAGIIIGVILTIITIVLQCIAFFTPHWKEISPNTHSLYVDGVDALIRTEALIYFNSVHRFTHLSYGLFQRCEYLPRNSSKFGIELKQILNVDRKKPEKKCTKNFLPSFDDTHFNECHSLQYYRFCSKTNEKKFDINHDYLLATFDISSNSPLNTPSTFSCDCQYPTYIKACHVLGIFALVFLFLTLVLFALFPLVRDRGHSLEVKCFGVLSSLLSMLFILINLITVSNHLHYESIAYLNAIERHYKLSEIYKLSQDTKLAIGQFKSSINIQIGYSTIIAWVAFALSIIDGILLMVNCKITEYSDNRRRSTIVSTNSLQQNHENKNEDYSTSASLLRFSAIPIDPQPPPVPPSIVITDVDKH